MQYSRLNPDDYSYPIFSPLVTLSQEMGFGLFYSQEITGRRAVEWKKILVCHLSAAIWAPSANIQHATGQKKQFVCPLRLVARRDDSTWLYSLEVGRNFKTIYRWSKHVSHYTKSSLNRIQAPQ